MRIDLSWSDFKTKVANKGLSMQYRVKDSDYEIWANENGDDYVCYIAIVDPASTDQTDFENNYKNSINKSSFRYRPMFWKSNTEVDISQSNDTTIADIDVDGKLSAISAVFSKDDIDFVLVIDGTETLRINLDELGDDYELNDIDFPIKTNSNRKQIMIKFQQPVDVTSNITIKAKKTVSRTCEFLAGMIVYDKKVV